MLDVNDRTMEAAEMRFLCAVAWHRMMDHEGREDWKISYK
jgi:hypothetical protein